MSAPADALAGLTEISPGTIGTIELQDHSVTPAKTAGWFCRTINNIVAIPADRNGRAYPTGAVFDIGGFSNGADIIIPQNGYYWIAARGYDYTVLGDVEVAVRVLPAGSIIIPETVTLVSGDNTEGCGNSDIFQFNAGDQLNWYGWAANGGNVSISLTIMALGVLP